MKKSRNGKHSALLNFSSSGCWTGLYPNLLPHCSFLEIMGSPKVLSANVFWPSSVMSHNLQDRNSRQTFNLTIEISPPPFMEIGLSQKSQPLTWPPPTYSETSMVYIRWYISEAKWHWVSYTSASIVRSSSGEKDLLKHLYGNQNLRLCNLD